MTEPQVLQKLKQFKDAIVSKNTEIMRLKEANEDLKNQLAEIKDRACTESIEYAIDEIGDVIANSTTL